MYTFRTGNGIEHIIHVALEVQAEDHERAHTWVQFRLDQLRVRERDTTSDRITAYWVAEDDRMDGSDRDSAVFVPKGTQHLHRTGALPRDDDGHIRTSAEYGEQVMVQIEWNTDEHGAEIGEDQMYPCTFHGPFFDDTEAQAWMDDYPDDTNVHDMTTVPLNSVRPTC